MTLEAHLRAGVAACALERRHGAFDELRVEHGLTDLETRIRRALLVRERRQCRARLLIARVLRAAALLPRTREPVAAPAGTVGAAAPACARLDLRREPLERAFRQFIEKARTDVVARLSVQHAALRERQIEPLF